jgi:hypothetical protein
MAGAVKSAWNLAAIEFHPDAGEIGYGDEVYLSSPNGPDIDIYFKGTSVGAPPTTADNAYRKGGVTLIDIVTQVVTVGTLADPTVIPVVYPTALSVLPSGIFLPVQEKTNPSDDNIPAVSIDSITTTGYNVNLPAPAVAGHVYHCAHLLPTAGSDIVTQTIAIAGALIGATEIPVVYPTGLTAPPRNIFLPVQEKTNPSDDNIPAVSIDSITTTGYNVNLPAPAVAGHVYHCAHLPASPP